MSGRTRWIIAVVVVMAVALAVVLWLGRRVTPRVEPRPEGTHTVSDVLLQSPELSIEVDAVRWTHHPGYTDWACLLECRESGGCRAEVQLLVDYISQGEEQRLTVGGRIDAAFGEIVRIGRAERPSVAVDRLERVTVDVIAAYRQGAPTPTPME